MIEDRLRLVVTGLRGQVVSALIERAPKDVEVIALGRPQIELSKRDTINAAFRRVGCDAIINAAAYTQVDQAESEPEIAMQVNGHGALHVAEAAKELNIPLIQISTDYIFNGTFNRPYREEDTPAPIGVYGRSKLFGEEKIKEIHPNHVILRTAWIFSPFGKNFVKTMLRLGKTQDEIRVVSDQVGNPTSAMDFADKLIELSKRVAGDSSPLLRGVFHMTGGGEASWADFAKAIFLAAEKKGYKSPLIKKINTSNYPTRARRPLNSRLDNSKLREAYGIQLSDWKESLGSCVDRILSETQDNTH